MYVFFLIFSIIHFFFSKIILVFCFRYMAKFKSLRQLNIKRCWMHYQILQICTDKENNGTRIFRLKFVLLKLFYFSLHCFLVTMFQSYRMLQFSNFFIVISLLLFFIFCSYFQTVRALFLYFLFMLLLSFHLAFSTLNLYLFL